MHKLGVVFFLLACLFVGCGKQPSITITESEFGAAWPFTVPSGELRCENGAVTFTVGSDLYGVNGTAKTRYKQDANYRDISTIWKDDAKTPGMKVDISPIIERGLGLCK